MLAQLGGVSALQLLQLLLVLLPLGAAGQRCGADAAPLHPAACRVALVHCRLCMRRCLGGPTMAPLLLRGTQGPLRYLAIICLCKFWRVQPVCVNCEARQLRALVQRAVQPTSSSCSRRCLQLSLPAGMAGLPPAATAAALLPLPLVLLLDLLLLQGGTLEVLLGLQGLRRLSRAPLLLLVWQASLRLPRQLAEGGCHRRQLLLREDALPRQGRHAVGGGCKWAGMTRRNEGNQTQSFLETSCSPCSVSNRRAPPRPPACPCPPGGGVSMGDTAAAGCLAGVISMPNCCRAVVSMSASCSDCSSASRVASWACMSASPLQGDAGFGGSALADGGSSSSSRAGEQHNRGCYIRECLVR